MATFTEQLRRFVRWFFNSSPTALPESQAAALQRRRDSLPRSTSVVTAKNVVRSALR